MKAHSPRHGSMQFWPRKRAKSEVARVRHFGTAKDASILGFSGYKVGMAHVSFTDTRDKSLTKKMQITWPVTIVECPPLTVFSVRFYKDGQAVGQVYTDKLDKHMAKHYKNLKGTKKFDDISDFDDIMLVVHTNPSMTSIGKKKPEIFEVALGGKKDDKIAKAKELLGKQVAVSDVFKNGQFVDLHGITKGKGYQGPVRRFGIGLRAKKSEKTKRGPGSLGGWTGHAHFMYRIAHAGQMGYHQRTEYNKQILKIDEDGKKITPGTGFHKYGPVKNSYILLKGSVIGPRKRLVKFIPATRQGKNKDIELNVEVVQ